MTMKLSLFDPIPQLNSDKQTPADWYYLSPSKWLWRDALYQSRWGFCVYPDNVEAENIMRVAHKLMLISQYFYGKEIDILSWLRCRPYNQLIGGAKNSYHVQGLAVDFSVRGVLAKDVRQVLSTELDALDIRMERLNDNDGWTHIDLGKPTLNGRFFYP